MEDFPYKAEYAKTGRAKCRHCKNGISQGDLRLAAMVQSFFHDGKDCHWFHSTCFFNKHRPNSTDQIEHFEDIRYEDQKVIKDKIESMSGILLPETSKPKKGKKRAAEEAGTSSSNARLNDFGVEYSKSSRAACVGCGDVIMKDEVRIKKMDYTTEVGVKFGGQPLWHHVKCFAQVKGDYDFYLGGEELPGFRDLDKQDQKMVKSEIKAIKIDATQAKKLKSEPKDKDEVAKESELEKLIEKQTKQLFKVRDAIKACTTKGDLQNILFVNQSGMVEGNDGLLDRCADFLTFGAIPKCSKCHKGDLMFAKYGYKCNGNIDSWTMCDNFEEKPKRTKCVIPSDLKKSKKDKEEGFFSKYKSKIEDRAVRPNIAVKVKKGEEEEKRVYKAKREREPLYGMHIIVLGKTVAPKDELKARIHKLGGKVVTKFQEKIAFVISNKDEVEKMNTRMQEAKSFDIQVVPESFIDAIEKDPRDETFEKIKSLSICDWGSDPLSRIPQEEKNEERESMYSKHAKKATKMIMKNGAEIFAGSNLEEIAHVYRDKITNTLYTANLNLIDIVKNKNSFYKIQVLEADNGRKYWLYRTWGRIGTTIGDMKIDTYSSADDACEEFERFYEDKTGNMFGTSNFQKFPNKYYPVENEYADPNMDKKLMEKQAIPSKLPKAVQELLKLMFDIDTMKKTMLEFEIDLEKMPLGRLSKKTLHSAYETLNELDQLVVRGAAQNEFIGLSNKFFSLVPHSFGMKKAPIIDTLELIKSKREMIDSLLEIELAYSMLQDDGADDNVNPIDNHYEKLKTDMKPLDHKSDEFTLIKKYVENTHAKTHDQYELEVLEVFKIERSGEKRRYKPFRKLHNRQLLWHGSRLTNYAGILSHGLKIAPPEAPCTGYMFGKGIYFADMVSKSANYCFTNTHQPIGLMLLSEVALGDMHELTKASFVQKLPDGKHSTKGIGKTSPNPDEFHKRDDGVIIPCGTPVENKTLRSELLYNEYIVYDVAQVNIQYLLKMKFNYNKRR